jgi:hypothetical protein
MEAVNLVVISELHVQFHQNDHNNIYDCNQISVTCGSSCFLCRIRDFIALLNDERIVIEAVSDKSVGSMKLGSGVGFPSEVQESLGAVTVPLVMASTSGNHGDHRFTPP